MHPKLLIADNTGRIFDVPHLMPVGSRAGILFPLEKKELIRLPYDSELFMLRDRVPIGYDSHLKQFLSLAHKPSGSRRERCFPVAAFISPGHTATQLVAYTQDRKSAPLPMFSYSPVTFYKKGFYVPAVRVDRERRQDSRLMDMREIRLSAKRLKKLFPKNRLFSHLVRCALVYNCPAGKNFFLQRYEAPLPVSPRCNARCLGCISCQPKRGYPVTQPRISFMPTPEEIAEIALFHINSARMPVVSFGQGCEGEPLLAGDTLLKSVRIIRKKTRRGTINLNTNGSRPRIIERLLAYGMDSVRVSLNSAQRRYYNSYYRPSGYSFDDVLKSIARAKHGGGFVSINYLTFPGFTDSMAEVAALSRLLGRYKVDMIQWRNLNLDPAEYMMILGFSPTMNEIIGIGEAMRQARARLPDVRFGYFNPPKEKWRRR